jgi:hypothetical protein
MPDDGQFESRLRNALGRATADLPLRIDADTVRDRIARSRRVPGWLVPLVVPVGVAVLIGVILLNAFPGPTDGPGASATGPSGSPASEPSVDRTASPTPAPTPHPAFRSRAATASADGRFFLVGGRSTVPVASAVAFDGLTWNDLPSLPEPRVGPAAVAMLDGRLIVFGGEIDGQATDSTLLLEPGADAWTAVDPMPAPQADMAAVAIDGRAYLFGGSIAERRTDVLIFDPDGSGWSVDEPMPVPLEHATAGLLGDVVYVMGGRVATDDEPATEPPVASRVLRFDTSTATWTEVAPAPVAGPPLSAVAADGRLWAIGRPGPERLGVAFYEPELDTWTLTDRTLPPGNTAQVVIPMPGRLIVVGSYQAGMTITVVETEAP